MNIPVYSPFLNGKEKEYVNDCIDTTWISSKGKYVTKFERAFADYIGTKYGVAVTNGTVAIQLALLALGIGKDDEVLVPSFTYIASVNPIVYVGATPVFVDSLQDTWQIDPADIEEKITEKTKAIIAVHLYGHPCDMKRIVKIAKEHKLFVIEDCAEAIGTEYDNRRVGSFGDVGCFSFFGNKTITTGEGGMIVVNDKTVYTRAMSLKGQGLAMHREYWHDIIGYNFRMTNIAAAIGLAQMETINEVIEMKRSVAEMYRKYLPREYITLFVGHDGKDGIVNSYWMCTGILKNYEKREELRDYLKIKGIETRPTFYPVHTMPMYSTKYHRIPNSETISWKGINLPSFPQLSEKEIVYICTSIKEFFEDEYAECD